jgi:hypothetical protein
MESQNIEEYKELRHEIMELKGCITTYVGFVLLVVSPAFWELAKSITSQANPIMSFVALIVGIGLKVVLFLLLYKFNSHNRYCGYCKLLEQEVFCGKDKSPKDRNPGIVFLWEICLDRLRSSSSRKDGLDIEIERYRGSQPSKDTLLKMSRKYSGPAPTADEHRLRKGWKLLFKSESEGRGTWQFPLHVAKVFAALDFGLFLLGLVLFRPSASQILQGRSLQAPLLFLLWLSFLGLLVFLWLQFMAGLYRQMRGSETVDAFCWKFVPIRYRILENLGLTDGYKLIGYSPLS